MSMIFIYEKRSCTNRLDTIWVWYKLINDNARIKGSKISVLERITFVDYCWNNTIGIKIFQNRFYLIIIKDGNNFYQLNCLLIENNMTKILGMKDKYLKYGRVCINLSSIVDAIFSIEHFFQ